MAKKSKREMIQAIAATDAYANHAKVINVDKNAKRTECNNVRYIHEIFIGGDLSLVMDEGNDRFFYSEDDRLNNVSCKK